MGNALAATPLNTIERRDLRNAETAIKKGQLTFVEVGNALLTVREGKLYRESHKTFEAYCKDRWGFERRHAYRLIGAAAVADEMSPIGHKIKNESQARELGNVPEEDRVQVLEQATEATDGKPTAKAIREAAEQIVEPEEEAEEEEEEEAPLPPKAKVLDAKKHTPPADLIPVFEQVGEFKAISRELTALLKRSEELEKGAAGAWFEYGQLRTHIANAKHVLKFGTPYIVCTYCKGAGCKTCRQSGYLNQTPSTRNTDKETG